MEKIITITGLKKYFPLKSAKLFEKRTYNRALDDINLEIEHGETVGIVGESGSGKTTLGKLILGLHTPTEGTITYGGGSDARHPNLSVVFQDPFSSLNPRMTVFNIVKEPLEHREGARKNDDYRDTILSTLQTVGLSEEQMFRYPHEFSGGQRQRIAIARAIVSNPLFIVFDEPTSGLDVSVQAQILNLLKEMKEKNDLSYIFISHNLGVIKYLCKRIVVMYSGKILEIAENQELFDHALHPYTRKLLAAVPVIDAYHVSNYKDEIPREESADFSKPERGCIYYAKCPIRIDKCADQVPPQTTPKKNHSLSCWVNGKPEGQQI
jgi:peptide/nickel transport system ATP-binding protein